MIDEEGLRHRLTNASEDIFSERARWVQTWITARALPFIALLTLALSYYQIATGGFVLPRQWAQVVAGIMLFIVLFRAGRYLYRRQWHEVFGGYQASLAFLGLLLLLGDGEGPYSHLYWGVIIGGFWLVGYIYPRKWLMPGELAVIALVSAGLASDGLAPLPDWLFVLVMASPVMIYLQWRHQLLKPVLMLAALIVFVLINAEISGWQVLLAVAVALMLLWVAIYSIGKLNKRDASSFVQSVGVGVISGLLYAIVVVLLGFSDEAPLTWWSMFGLFSLIALVLYKKNGNNLLPLLMLWGTHWALITLTISWEEWMTPIVSGDYYGFQVGLLLGALHLRYLAVKLDNNRLLVWARLYLIVFALSIGVATVGGDELTFVRLMFTLAVFIIAITLAKGRELSKGPAWWRGVVNPRHVVAVRRILRKGGNFIGSIPFVGPTMSAVIKTFQVLAKLKRDGRSMHSGDLLMIAWVICLSLFLSLYLEKYVLSDDIAYALALGDDFVVETLDNEAGSAVTGVPGVVEERAEMIKEAVNSALEMMVVQSVYLLAGILFAAVALKERQPLYPLMSMVSFVLAPATIVHGEYFETAFFWLTSLVAAIGILSVRELSRQA